MIPFLPYLKAYAALVGTLATALLGIYGPDTTAGQILTVAVALATALATFVVPNIPVEGVDGQHELGRNERGATDTQQASVVVTLLLLAALAAALLLQATTAPASRAPPAPGADPWDRPVTHRAHRRPRPAPTHGAGRGRFSSFIGLHQRPDA